MLNEQKAELSDLEIAKKSLLGHSIALSKNGIVLTNDKRGVMPMLEFISSKTDLKGYTVADKIVGKAAASLFVLAQVKEVYAEVASESAKEYLENYSIKFSCGKLIKNIINRSGTGICPMEEAVLTLTSPKECYEAILKKLEHLNALQKNTNSLL